MSVVVEFVGWVELVVLVLCMFGCELCKLGYFLLCVLVLLIFSFILVVNLIVVLLWLLFGVWMMVV